MGNRLLVNADYRGCKARITADSDADYRGFGRGLPRIKNVDSRGQGVLEMAFVVILMTLLVGGIVNIWFWANNRIVYRQKAYNLSRVPAGTSSDDYELAWPLNATYGYAPANLTEEQVLLGAPRLGQNNPPSGDGGSNPLLIAIDNLRRRAHLLRSQGLTEEADRLLGYAEAAERHLAAAAELREQAAEKRAQGMNAEADALIAEAVELENSVLRIIREAG